MLDKIVISQDRRTATVHFDTHSVNLSSDQDVAALVTELFVEPSARLARSHEDTMWIITLPEEDAA